MFSNYLKVALRNIMKHKGHALINIAGLAIGLTCCILIMLWVQDELSYDRYHENVKDVYRVVRSAQNSNYTRVLYKTPPPLAEAMKNSFPEVLLASNYGITNYSIRCGERDFNREVVLMADQDIVNMLTFHFLEGDSTTALRDPHSVIITRDIADKYFKDVDPLGQTFDFGDDLIFTVSGVIENIPRNSTDQYDFIVPFANVPDFYKSYAVTLDDWSINGWCTYLLLDPLANRDEFRHKIGGFLSQFVDSSSASTLDIQNIGNIHLYSKHIEGDNETEGDIRYVYIFSIIAIFILGIASINFMNLSLAKSANRVKEIGVRKVVGANRGNLVKQFLGESFLMVLLSVLLSLGLAELLLPVFNGLAGKQLSLNIAANLFFYAGLFGIILLTGLLAGLYPALYLSALKPAGVMKGLMPGGFKGTAFKRILVTVQFSLSILLIVCTLVISSQLNFIQKKNLGFDRDHLVITRLRGEVTQRYEALRSELLKRSDVVAVAAASHDPTEMIAFSTHGVDWEGKNPDDKIIFNFAIISPDFLKTMKIDLLAGREFYDSQAADSNSMVINWAAAEAMNLENPIGAQIHALEADYTIVGLTDNFNYQSVHHAIEPLLMLKQTDFYRQLIVRIQSDDIPGTVAGIEKIWNNIAPNYPFELKFMDQEFEALYLAEQRMQTIFNYFALLAIILSCLGLLGLASYAVQKRTREIGLRKVLGASMGNLFFILSRDFLRSVLLANLIAWPIAWYFMNNWLEGFAYRTSLNWTVFFVSGLLAAVIAIATISYQTIKASLTNPVEVLKHE